MGILPVRKSYHTGYIRRDLAPISPCYCTLYNRKDEIIRLDGVLFERKSVSRKAVLLIAKDACVNARAFCVETREEKRMRNHEDKVALLLFECK